jgi:cobalt-zinc-cadmium resistance protein CzcA
VTSNHLATSFVISLFGVTLPSYAGNTPLTIAQAIESAIGQNPELSAERAEVEVAQGLKAAKPSLPPTMIFAGAMGQSPLSRNGQMENSIGISQTIPFPTKLTSESKVKTLEAEAAAAKLRARILELTANVKSLYFDLYGARKKAELLQEKNSIYTSHYQRLRASALSDRIVQGHRVWVQTEINLSENELIAVHETERISRGRLNVVMGNPPEGELPDLENPSVSDLPQKRDVPTSHPELQSLEFSQHAAEAAITGAKSLWLPDLSIQYRKANRFDGLMPNYYEFTVGLTLPFLFFWEVHGETDAANARARVASFKVEKTRLDLKMDLLESRARAESLKEQLSNYESKIVPQAEKRMKIAHGLVPSDMASLGEHREAMESLVNLRLSALSIRVDYEKAVAKLESLLANSANDANDKENP